MIFSLEVTNSTLGRMWNNFYTPLPLISKLPSEWMLYERHNDDDDNKSMNDEDVELFDERGEFCSSFLSKTNSDDHQEDELSKNKNADNEDFRKKQNTEKGEDEDEEGDEDVLFFKTRGTNFSVKMPDDPKKKEHKQRRLKCRRKSECEVIRKIANRMTANSNKDDSLFFSFKRDGGNVKK